MVQKRNKYILIVGFVIILFNMPFRAIATDFYCVPQEISLPYPGMLSNSPFYVVKKIRDKILKQFISRFDKKLEYYLFESKKNFAEMLIHNQKKNEAYVVSSGLRSGNYLTLFVSTYHHMAMSDVSIQNKLVCDFYSVIEFQIKKYTEIIAIMEDSELKKQLISIVEQLQLNKVGFDNLLTTMNSKRIMYE
jgi:hypothetical protein